MAQIFGNKYRNFQQDVSKKKENDQVVRSIRSRALVNMIVIMV